jgi:hypothetical protein
MGIDDDQISSWSELELVYEYNDRIARLFIQSLALMQS